MSATSAISTELVARLFGPAEAAIYNEMKFYIDVSDLQGKSKQDLEAIIQDQEELQNKSDSAKRSRPWSKYGPDKVNTFYGSLTAYSLPDDAQRQPAPPLEFGILSLPFKVQHRLMNEVALILEASCFNFVKDLSPEQLAERGWDCAERVELTRFKDLLEDACKKGHFPRGETVPTNKRSKKATLKKLDNLRECWVKIEEIRHIAVHRNHPSAARVIDLLRAAEDLLGCLNDAPGKYKISKLLQQTEILRDDMESERAKLKQEVSEAVEKLQEKKLKLVRKQLLEIKKMLTRDCEASNDPTTGSSLDDILGRLHEPNISSDNGVQEDMDGEGTDAAIQDQEEQNPEAISWQDAESAQTSTIQPFEVAEDTLAVNGRQILYDPHSMYTNSVVLTINFEGENSTEMGAEHVPNDCLLPDDMVEIHDDAFSAQPVPVESMSDLDSIRLHQVVDEPAFPSLAVTPIPVLDLESLPGIDFRDEELRDSQETAPMEMIATDELQPEEVNDSEKAEVDAAGDEKEELILLDDASTMPSCSSDRVKTTATENRGDVSIEET